jgi:hypothetical protein
MKPPSVLVVAPAQSEWAVALASALTASGFWCLCLDALPTAFQLLRRGHIAATVVAVPLHPSEIHLLERMRRFTSAREVVFVPVAPIEPDVVQRLSDARIPVLRYAAPSDVVAHLVRIHRGAAC